VRRIQNRGGGASQHPRLKEMKKGKKQNLDSELGNTGRPGECEPKTRGAAMVAYAKTDEGVREEVDSSQIPKNESEGSGGPSPKEV